MCSQRRTWLGQSKHLFSSLVIVFLILITFRFVDQMMFLDLWSCGPVVNPPWWACHCLLHFLSVLLYLPLVSAVLVSIHPFYLSWSLFLPDTATTVWFFEFNLICPLFESSAHYVPHTGLLSAVPFLQYIKRSRSYLGEMAGKEQVITLPKRATLKRFSGFTATSSKC